MRIDGNTPVSELIHSDDELMHWKYIKREKVNGKWVYTYENDKLGIKNFIDTKITGKAYKQHAREANNKKTETDNELFSTSQSRSHAEQTSKGYSQTDPEVARLKMKENALRKKSDSISREAAEAEANYKNKSVSGRIETNVRNLIDSAKDAVDRIKDKLGVDEREEYLKAKKSYDYTTSSRADAKNSGSDNQSVYDYDKGQMAPNTSNYWSKRARESAKKYIAAKKDYMNTPLGKIAQTTDRVKNWLDNLFKKKRK